MSKTTQNINPKNQESFEDAKKNFINIIWNKIPPKLRYPILAIIVIFGIFTATQSYWKGLIPKDKGPNRMYISGLVLENSKPVSTQLILVTNQKSYQETSDNTGFVVFNLTEKQKIKRLKYQKDDVWKDIPINDKELRASKKFRLNITNGVLDFEQEN